MVMESSVLPLTKFPALGVAVSVFIRNHWQGQCQNQAALAAAWKFSERDLILEGLGFKSTEASELEWKKEKATLAARGKTALIKF
jgi:hypothetical protein